MARRDMLNKSSDQKSAIEEIIQGNKKNKSKYAVNIIFDAEFELKIREKAKMEGLPVATYIKSLVMKDINN